jgi:hypothetical protein
LQPPRELTSAEKRIWISIVSDRKPEHFVASDKVLLIAYCHAAALEAALARQITAKKSDSTMIARWERAVRAMVSLSMRLRLSPQSRSPTHSAARPNRREAPSISYLDKMKLESNGHDEQHDDDQ